MTKKDQLFGLLAGLCIGLLAIPALSAVLKPALYHSISLFILPFFFVATPVGLYLAALLGKKINGIWQIGKFGVIGVLNTLVDLGVLAVVTAWVSTQYGVVANDTLVMIGTRVITFYTLYKAISFIVANTNSYFWNKYWTFAGAALQKTKTKYLQFFVVSIVGFIINITVSSIVFTIVAKVPSLTLGQAGSIGALAGTVIGLVWNFVGYKFIVFKEK